MMKWASIIISILRLAQSLIDWRRSSEYLAQGEDKAIAKAALDVLEATNYGKLLRERIRQSDDDAADRLWDEMTDV